VCFFKGDRDGPLYFVDSSKIPTPVSRYGSYYSKNYSGSITPLSCHSHQFEMMHLENLREKLNRLSRDKGSYMLENFSMIVIVVAVVVFFFLSLFILINT